MFSMQEESSLKFSERTRSAMTSCGVSAAKLAEKARVSKGYVSGLLAGKKNTPSAEVVKKFSEVLEVNSRWLLDGHGPMKPDPQRDLTLALARARTERYSQAAAQALEETLEDLRDHLEMLAASGPALSAAAVQACKDRIDAFVQELTRQRAADTQAQLTD
jgi:transcriptional regulator with XRE-family HTH domain